MQQHVKPESRRQSVISLSEREVLGLPPVLFGHPDDAYTRRAAWAAHRRQTDSRCG
jgi:hypothetical protein